jgi:ubiquinone/menaquinone biosynthesis C-methylase UbiE
MTAENSEDYNKWHDAAHGADDQSQLKLEQWHENALSLAPSLAGIRVLEIGCGAGDFALTLGKRGAFVEAIDFSSKAIQFANSKKQFHGDITTNFQTGDAMALPFKDKSFDLIFSCECLEHVPNPQVMLNEAARVLKTQGQLILTTENYSNALILAWIVSWLRKQPFNSGVLPQPIEHFFLFWKIRRMLSNAGIKTTRMLGSHHVFFLLPKLHPHTFVIERFKNPIVNRLFCPFARHMAYEAIKK